MKRCYVCFEYANDEDFIKKGELFRHPDCNNYQPKSVFEKKMEDEMTVFFRRNPEMEHKAIVKA